MLNELFKWIGDKLLLIITIVMGILWVTYRTPQEQQIAILNFFNSFGLAGIVVQTSFDLPSIFMWFFILVGAVLFVDSVFIGQKAFHSDYVYGEGVDHGASCIGANLKIVGDWCYIRGEGIKEFPIEGNHIFANFATHTHRIANHVIMEGHTVPKTPLTHIPLGIKFDVRQRRLGLFGATICSTGYISTEELATNKEFTAGDEYKAYLKNDEVGKTIQTQAFIDSIRDLNRDLNQIIELNSSERESITAYLRNMVAVGKSMMDAGKESSVFDKVMGRQ